MKRIDLYQQNVKLLIKYPTQMSTLCLIFVLPFLFLILLFLLVREEKKGKDINIVNRGLQYLRA